MMEWSLTAEYLAIIAAVVITVNFYEGKYVPTPKRRLLEAGLLLALFYILLDVICVNLVTAVSGFLLKLACFLNILYFITGIWLSFLTGLYVFELLLEHVYDKSCEKKAHIGLFLLTGGYTLLVLTNPLHNLVFGYDGQGNYRRGPLGYAGYAVVALELAMMLKCWYMNRRSISRDVTGVIILLPCTLTVLIGLQVLNPQLILNGAIVIFTLLILFINFQGMKGEQDNLTKAGSRKSLYGELKLRLGSGQHFQVILVTLQNFAAVNQNFGYSRGDEFLYAVADWLDNFGEDSRAFRFGSVCFALLCPHDSREREQENLERIQKKFMRNWKLGEIECILTANIGSLIYEDQKWEATQVVELLAQLQEEIRKPDAAGPVCCGNEMVEVLERKKYLTALMREAIAEDRFRIWYQPVFDCGQKKFTSAEALVRLADYDGQLISPAEFIPLAEENGMIVDISWLILEKVCRFLGENRELPVKSLSVNFSMQQFMDPMILHKVEACMERYGVTPDKLKLEITERVFLYDQEYMRRIMGGFTARGVGFYLDDFGTGYSNFASVMHLPFECIKLDRSLFGEVGKSGKDDLIIRTMSGMFHEIGMDVIAEGIETKEQLDAIMDFGLNRVQGFIYSRLVPEEKLARLLEKNPCNVKTVML